ncbi:unnamed protein product [Adineta ricciae]|uniref:Uncharacterized protein n=1 Tax=Adineta ricciae TaxID=249248 RepID=A0A815HK77_ADIRI|nr:unnamed protein product [Adineta ricciae]CAF1527699.1 unnamed protein product [Adineta ricciae]
MYPFSNHRLRTRESDSIIVIRFVLRDLDRQLEQLQKIQAGSVSFNNFSSIADNRDVTSAFAESIMTGSNIYGIVFELTIDTSKRTVSFANVKLLSNFSDENEILFSIPLNRHLLAIFHLRTGRTPLNTSKFSKAFSSYEEALKLLQNLLLSNHPDLALSHLILGTPSRTASKFSEPLTFCEKGLEILLKIHLGNHLNVAVVYDHFGSYYTAIKDYSEACLSYEKCLEIYETTQYPNYSTLGAAYNNIGMMYCSMKQYSTAFGYYFTSLQVNAQTHPVN